LSNQANIKQACIKILSPQLANQIAAGEVVERPASVVKELVENSLDAEATRIHVEIDQGGQKRILIRDDGKGIVKDELQLALSRHATSKISNISDLDNITSMGFRGEALASISSVSRLTLTSKPAQQAEAWQANTEGQDMHVDILPAAHPDGTSIEVLDLFFNTPARRKFLRSGKTELQHIENILKRLALTRYDVQFSLVHNNKQIFKYPSCKTLAKRVEQVCGKGMLEGTVAVDYAFENISLRGWCSELGAGVATRDHQYTFVNGRMMRDKLLSHALRQVFEDTLAPQCFPSYVLFLQVPPDQLDINVHPAKHEVRFHQARKVHDLVFKGVTQALSSSSQLDATTSDSSENMEVINHDYILPLDRVSKEQTLHDYSVSNNVGGSSGPKGYGQYKAPNISQTEKNANHAFYQSTQQAQTHANNHLQTLEQASSNKANESTLLSTSLFHSPYLLLSESKQLKVLHVERILSTMLLQRITQSTASQPLLMPVSVAANEVSCAKGMNDVYEGLSAHGMLIEHRAQKLILKQVPSTLRQLPWAAMFSQFVEQLCSEQQSSDLLQLLSKALAKVWLPLLEQDKPINLDIVNVWLQEISPALLQDVVNECAQDLNLEQALQTPFQAS